MDFLKKADVINIIVQEIAHAIIPKDWKKIVYYTERLRDDKIGLRNKDTAKCWVRNNLKLYTADYPLRSSMEPYKTINMLFDECEQSEKAWCGLLITLNSDGKYESKFYYEGTPLLNGNDDELNKRLLECE